MIRTFIQTTAIIMTLCAGVLLVRSTFVLSSKEIAGLSSTYFGYNKSLIKAFSQQQADTKMGVIFLLLSFLFQMINQLWPMRIGDFGVSRSGILFAIIFSALIFVSALKISSILSGRMQTGVLNIVEKE